MTEISVNNEIKELPASPSKGIYMDDRLQNSLFAPDKAEHYQKLAMMLAKTDLVPPTYKNKPMELFIAMAHGYALGLTVEQSIQDIVVINGKPTVYGDTLLGIVKAQPDFVDILEEPIIENDTVTGFICTVRRRGQSDVVRTFTLDLARKARLLSRQIWQQYPERMLQMRARAYAARDAFPDALKGIKSYEEVIDYIDVQKINDEEKPISRADEIKTHLLRQQGRINDDKTHTEIMSETENTENQEVAGQNEGYEILDSIGESETSVDSTTEPPQEKLIGLEKLNEINMLMKELNFDKKRITKVLEFYQCEHMSDLNEKQGQDLINKLKGMKKND